MHKSEDYPASYYEATRNIKTDYPHLRGELKVDVCVIGAGFSGLATALYLKEKGTDVALIEANKIGWGASGRNGGQIVSGYGEDTHEIVEKALGKEAGDRAWDLGFETISILKSTIERHSIDCDLTWGYLRAAMTKRQATDLSGAIEAWEKRGFPGEATYIEKDGLQDYVGSEAYTAALYTDGDGHLHPLNLAVGEAQIIKNFGGHIFEDTPALDIDYESSPNKVKITTPEGTIIADTVVLCGNAYLEKLEPKIRPMLIPGYTSMLATEPMSKEYVMRLLPKNTAVSDMRSVLDYYRLSPDGRMLWGGLPHWSGNETENPEPQLRSRMLKIFPWLAGVRTDYCWSGRIGVSANLNPQIGRLQKNVYYVQAYSGHGVASTHLSGTMISDAITSESKDFEMFASIKHLEIPPYPIVHKLARAWGMNSKRITELF